MGALRFHGLKVSQILGAPPTRKPWACWMFGIASLAEQRVDPGRSGVDSRGADRDRSEVGSWPIRGASRDPPGPSPERRRRRSKRSRQGAIRWNMAGPHARRLRHPQRASSSPSAGLTGTASAVALGTMHARVPSRGTPLAPQIRRCAMESLCGRSPQSCGGSVALRPQSASENIAPSFSSPLFPQNRKLGVDQASIWGQSRVDWWSMLGRIGVDAGSMRARFGVDLASCWVEFWGPLGVDLGSILGRSGVDSGGCGVDAGSIWL